jgi:hypothetical protein
VERAKTVVKIMIFGKTECAKCRTTKNKVSHLVSTLEPGRVEVLFHDQETPDGRAKSR